MRGNLETRALALVGLTLLAGVWPKRLWHAAFGVAVSAAYLGVVAVAQSAAAKMYAYPDPTVLVLEQIHKEAACY